MFVMNKNILWGVLLGMQVLNATTEPVADEAFKTALIEPYFDDVYYTKQYGERLNNQKPVRHFLAVDFKGCWTQHTDPNDWFNTTLYKRCFPCDQNPFVDFLTQPVCTLNDSTLQRFYPQQKRGLHIEKDNTTNKSFYQSGFLFEELDGKGYQNPEIKDLFRLAKYFVKRNNHSIICHHNVNFYTHWSSQGGLDPIVFNKLIAHREPLFYKLPNIECLRSYLLRISDGCDIVFYFESLTERMFIAPGALSTWVNPKELSPQKEFSVSFLLSLAQRGDLKLHRENFNYHLRPQVWRAEKELNQPTRFYVSRRDIAKYPKEYHERVLPTESKKWVFDSQFHIAMENCRQTNYMTEKLFGCFASLTVPIYLGCPNVRDWFDERGMFIAESVEDIIKICQSLTPETYEKMLPYLQENKKRTEALMQLEAKYMNEFFADIQSGKI